MTREIDPRALEEVRERLPLVKPEYIYFFEDDPKIIQGSGAGNLPLSALVIGINHQLDTKERIETVLHEIIESIPRFNYKSGAFSLKRGGERKIDAISHKICRNYPEIRDYIAEQIEQANKKVLNPADRVCFCLSSLIRLSDEFNNFLEERGYEDNGAP